MNLYRWCLLAALPLVIALGQLRAEEPKAIESHDLHQLYRLGERLYSGAQPEGEAAFAELQKLGVKTIISVDGARTDVELAKKYGMRYVHQPIGYEGISGQRAIEIAKAAKTFDEGPVYVHCHHGEHRGPAAAAVCAIALEGWTPAQATAWMKEAGTSPSYVGLYRSVESFRKPTAEQYNAATNDFPSLVEPASFIEAMVQISLTFDQLKELAADDFRTPADMLDVTASHEALQLNEHYRELMRTDEYKMQDDDLQVLMEQAEQHSAQLHKILVQFEKERPAAVSELRKAADKALGLMSDNCKSCHVTFRDKRAVE